MVQTNKSHNRQSHGAVMRAADALLDTDAAMAPFGGHLLCMGIGDDTLDDKNGNAVGSWPWAVGRVVLAVGPSVLL
jgi:hypothetical protein